MVLNQRGVSFLAGAVLLIGLAGCSSDDALDDAVAAGSPFSQSLFAAYKQLSQAAMSLPRSPESADDGNFFDYLFGADDGEPNEVLAQTFSAKALQAAAGNEPEAEPGSTAGAQILRSRLVAAVATNRNQYPDQAARAQADYDCWVLYGATPGGAAASQACKAALDTSLPQLEATAPPAPPPTASAPVVATAPMPAPAPAPATAPTGRSDFTVHFDFDSWTLKAEQLKVLTEVISAARMGGQSNIIIVGHTDTSGSPDYNQRLSVQRANVVLEALVSMGANRSSLHASGVGETDLAVQTDDGVKEAKNRRTVVALRP